MIFCKNCFQDSEIIRRISSLGKLGDCPICGNTNTLIYNTEEETNLDEIFDPLLELFTIDEELPIDYPSTQKLHLTDELKRNWSIFSNISDVAMENIIQNISCSFWENNPGIFTNKVGIIERCNKDYLFNHSLVKTNNWDDFIDSVKNRNRFHTNIINTDILKRYCTFIEKMYPRGYIFYRGRISEDKKGLEVNEMGAPPPHLAKAGRVNADGISHLYLANDEKTVIHETRTSAFDVITVGAFILKQDIVVVNFRDLETISPFVDDFEILEHAINIEHLKRINQEIARILRRNDSSLDYIPTQYISDFIKSISNQHGETLYHGVEYNSTMNIAGYNLAIFYPQLFECVGVKTFVVEGLEYSYRMIS
jgi:hypothetical protein